MKHTEGCFPGVRNSRIYHQAWVPEGIIKAVVLVVHGIGDHSGRYMNVVNHLLPQGYAVYGFDHIGHGKSDGRREFVRRFDDFTSTLGRYEGMIREIHRDKHLFIFGHSMGGLIAACYLLEYESHFRGAILSAPSTKVSDSVSAANIVLSKVLSIIAPTAGVLALDPAGLSRDPQVVEAYIRDPLVFHGKTTARLASELIKAIGRLTREAPLISLPLLVLQGSEDQLVNPAGAEMLYDRVSSKNKRMKVFQGLHHELFNEPERLAVLSEVSAWLDTQSGGRIRDSVLMN